MNTYEQSRGLSWCSDKLMRTVSQVTSSYSVHRGRCLTADFSVKVNSVRNSGIDHKKPVSTRVQASVSQTIQLLHCQDVSHHFNRLRRTHFICLGLHRLLYWDSPNHQNIKEFPNQKTLAGQKSTVSARGTRCCLQDRRHAGLQDPQKEVTKGFREALNTTTLVASGEAFKTTTDCKSSASQTHTLTPWTRSLLPHPEQQSESSNDTDRGGACTYSSYSATRWDPLWRT